MAARREKRAQERASRLIALAAGLGEPQTELERQDAQIRAEAARAVRIARMAKPNARRKCNWTRAEESFLACWWGLRPDAWIARQLGRTVEGCELRAWRLGVRRTDNHFGFEQTLELFGIVRPTLRRWMERGWVTGRKAPIRTFGRTRWSIAEVSLLRLVTEKSWLVDPARMKPGHYLTAKAIEAHAREGWLTTAQAAERVHVAHNTFSKYLTLGYGPFFERPQHGGRGNVMRLVRERDLDAIMARAEEAAAQHFKEGARRRELGKRSRRASFQEAA